MFIKVAQIVETVVLKENDPFLLSCTILLWLIKIFYKKMILFISGCGSVASDTRGLRFESSHGQNFIYIEHLFTVNCVLKRRK